MANDTLRLKAELEDQFSGPLKRLKGEIGAFHREGARQMQDVSKAIGTVEGAIHSTGRAASTVLNPAMSALGITSLTTAAALAGITGALSKLAGNLSSLGQLSRDTGIAAKTLQEFQGVAGRFNLSQEQVAQGAQNFADKMRVFSRGQGDLWKWTLQQGTNTASRQAFQSFADDLAKTSDEGEKLKKALSFGQTIKDPRGQRIFFQEFFGNADLARIAQGQLGSVEQLFKQFRDKVGPFDPKAVQQAEDYQRAINDLKGSMQTIGTTIAREVLPYVSGLAHYLDEAVKGERGPAIVAIREAMAGVGAELAKVDWKEAGKEAGAAFKAILASLKPLAESLGKTVELMHALRTGSITDVLRVTTGGQGTLGKAIRMVAPRAGDDEIGAKAEVEALRRELKAAEYDQETGAPALDFKSREPVLKKRLSDAEAELSRLQGRTPEQRQKDFEASNERLRKSVDNLSDEMKRRAAEQGLPISKSSTEGDGPFGGARIQTAAFSGGGGFRRFGGLGGGASLPGGGSGPGYVGEAGPAGPLAGRSFGGGRFNGLGGGGSPGPMFTPDSPQGRAARAMQGGAASVARGGLAANQQEAYAAARAEGLSDAAARALVANMSGESLRNPRDHHWDRKHMSQGIVQWDPQRAEAIRRKFGAYPKDMSVTDQTRAAIDEIRTNPRFRRTARELEGNDPNAMLRALVENYEVPQDTGRAIAERQRFYRGFTPNGRASGAGGDAGADPNFFPNGAPRILKPSSMGGAPGITMADADRLRATRDSLRRRPDILADANDERRRPEGSFYSEEEDRRAARDLGIALRATKAKADAEQQELRLNSARLTESAAKAGVVGTNVRGDVTTIIERAGSEARAKTVATGNLFGKPVIVNGRQMRKADD